MLPLQSCFRFPSQIPFPVSGLAARHEVTTPLSRPLEQRDLDLPPATAQFVVTAYALVGARCSCLGTHHRPGAWWSTARCC